MLTLLIYVVVIAAVAAALFFVAGAVFGRGEELGPLAEGTTATVLPAEGVTGADVNSLKFQQTLRGYKPSEVDWALERLGGEIDMLRSRLSAAEAGEQLWSRASVSAKSHSTESHTIESHTTKAQTTENQATKAQTSEPRTTAGKDSIATEPDEL